MAQLKDSLVQGSLRVTDKIFTNSLTASDLITARALEITDTNAVLHIKFNRSNYNYISIPSGSEFDISAGVAATAGSIRIGITASGNNMTSGYIWPGVTNVANLGSSDLKWANVWSTKINNLTLTAATTGFTIAGGTTSKTLTVSDTVTIAAGTGAATKWGVAYYSATNAITSTGAGTAGQYLKSNATSAPTWATFSSSTVGLGNVSNNSKLNGAAGTKGDMIYWSDKDTPARLGIGTARHILVATADGPAWSANAHIIDESGSSVANKRNELVLGNATASSSNGSSFGRLALYSENTAGTYLVSASGTAWKTATLQAKDGTIAYTADITSAIQALDSNLNSTTPGAGKTLTAFSQTDGKVSAKFENISITASQAGLGNVSNNSNLNSTTGTKGDMIYWSAASTPERLAIGTENTFLKATTNGPNWTNTIGNLTIGGTVDTDAGKTIASNSTFYLKSAADASIIFYTNNTSRGRFDTNGHFIPETTRTYNLGAGDKYWKGAYIWADGAINYNSIYCSPGAGSALYVSSEAARLKPTLWNWPRGNRGNVIYNMAGQNITIEYTTNSGSTWAAKTGVTNIETKRSLTREDTGSNGYGNIGNTTTSNAGTTTANGTTTYNTHPNRVAGQGVRITFACNASTGSAHYGWWDTLAINLAGYKGTYTLQVETCYYNSSGAETWVNLENVRTFCNNTSWDGTLYFYPEKTYYWEGANKNKRNDKRYIRKLRLTLLCTAVQAANTAQSANRYSGWIRWAACWATDSCDLSTSTTYPLSSRYMWCMSRYAQPYYITDTRLGRVCFPTDEVHIDENMQYTAANTAAYSTLVLGNGDNVNALNRHREGRIYIYSAATKAHVIYGASTTTEYSHHFPNATGWIATGGNGSSTGAGDKDTPVFLTTSGTLTAMTGKLGVAHGGTGATDAAGARTNLGLSCITAAGNIEVNKSSTTNEATVMAHGKAGKIYLFSQGSTTGAFGLYSVNAGGTDRIVLNCSQNGDITTGYKIYGAVWNDYAEFRQANSTEPGRVVIEKGNDTLTLSTARLQPGAEIISDTFGFAIGQTNSAKTPIATSGRVLAYPYESREEFKANIGKPVCSGPNGTVSIMTQEEYEKYGYCAIGTISAVPDYEEWGSDSVAVDGRVWIRVR